ncbi:MAG: asparaginase [Pseudomonadota bacterium]
MNATVPLIELSRGQTPENQHLGAVAVVSAQGRLLASAGDAWRMTFTRSTIKPLQALPFMQAGGAKHFGFGSEQVAMLCASHSGENMHVAQVQGMLDKAGLNYKALRCGCHVPYFTELGLPGVAGAFDERHHNCSGKHSGFLAYCVQHGLPLADYLDPAHPLQQAVRRSVARAAGLEEGAMRDGIDGCSAPNFAMPLANLARAYARLASGTQDAEFGESFGQMAGAMAAHPQLVSGTRRSDEAFMRAGRGDWVTKVGADGVQAFASRSRREAFAVKILDGNMPALFAATVEVLEQLGWMDDGQRAALAPWRAQDIMSVRGVKVGERKAVFSLAGAQG